MNLMMYWLTRARAAASSAERLAGSLEFEFNEYGPSEVTRATKRNKLNEDIMVLGEVLCEVAAAEEATPDDARLKKVSDMVRKQAARAGRAIQRIEEAN